MRTVQSALHPPIRLALTHPRPTATLEPRAVMSPDAL